jgi:hypothetical protein
MKELSDATNAYPLFGAETVASLSTKANDSAVIHNTGNETITDTKTFSNVTLGSTDLQLTLDSTLNTWDDQTVGGRKTFTGSTVFTKNDMTFFNGNYQLDTPLETGLMFQYNSGTAWYCVGSSGSVGGHKFNKLCPK